MTFVQFLLTVSVTCSSLFFGASTAVIPQKENHHSLKFYNGCALKNLVKDESNTKFLYFWTELLKPMLKVRQPGSNNLADVHEHIKLHFNKLTAWTVETDQFAADTPHGNKQFTNIIVTQTPEMPKKLTLACHTDSKVMKGFIGATDSAVPCAILLDLATRLDDWLKVGNGKAAKDYSLRLLFFDGEEAFNHWTSTDSLYGSRHLAELWKTEADSVDPSKNKLQTIHTFILLDLIGAEGMRIHNFFSNTEPLFKGLLQAERKLRQEGQLACKELIFSDSQSYVNSAGIDDDHKPFLRQGVPVLHLIAFPFPAQWHELSDNEANLDPNTINDFNKILRVFVAQFLHLKVKGSCR